jgi:hypothetical protein
MLLLPGNAIFLVRAEPRIPDDVVKIPADQLDALVAPIALYPDNLLSQTLVASTYPLEIVQLQQWLDKNQDLASNQQKLAEAVKKQQWDPSIQAMAALPDVVKRLADDIQWTTDLGNAFLAQQSDVMDAVQRMRRKAQDKGSLKSNEQQRVQAQTIESKQVIVIEQANPQVVYVPSYDPVYVYGPAIYPYPAIYYPPYYGGWYTAAAISFGVGITMGFFWGGGWGWGCGWGGGDININRNNNFNRNTNIGGGNRVNPLGGNRGNLGGDRGNLGGGNRGNLGGGNRVNPLGGGDKWQHNPAHRGGAPYGDRNTADRFGGTTRGDSLANRQRSARGQIGRQGGKLGSATRPGGIGSRGGFGDRGSFGGGGFGNRGSSNRSGLGSGGVGNRSSLGSSGSLGNRTGIGSSDRVGNRSLGNRSADRGAFGGFSGSNSRSSLSRGSSSMSRGSYGGASRSGGGFGGGSRGGFGGGGRGGGGGRR